MFELDDLVYSAGGEVIGSTLQLLEKFHPATLIGQGKIEEIQKLIEDTEADFVIIDHSLTGVQIRNLETAFEKRVLDRNQLILDIFAQRAQSYEGKLQVELAQMMDQLPRMVGGWLGSLSRLGGGIGTRGPGEKALELDRRVVRNKMKMIKEKLKSVRKNREQNRAKRNRNNTPSFALIGYTNAGKSTLMNALTNSDVEAKDLVFATLDPTTKKIFLPEIGPAVITDTVGFIRNLPTQLIEAFKATLEESGDADVLLHVIDLSSSQMKKQVEVVNNLMHEFDWDKKPVIHIFNKLDQALLKDKFAIQAHPRVFISAQTGEGVPELKKLMIDSINLFTEEIELYVPRENQNLVFEIGRESKVISQEQAPNGTLIRTLMTNQQIEKWGKYKS